MNRPAAYLLTIVSTIIGIGIMILIASHIGSSKIEKYNEYQNMTEKEKLAHNEKNMITRKMWVKDDSVPWPAGELEFKTVKTEKPAWWDVDAWQFYEFNHTKNGDLSSWAHFKMGVWIILGTYLFIKNIRLWLKAVGIVSIIGFFFHAIKLGFIFCMSDAVTIFFAPFIFGIVIYMIGWAFFGVFFKKDLI